MTKTRTPEPLSSDGRCMQPIVPREMILNASRDNARIGGGRQPKTTTRKVLSPGEIRQRTLEREEMQSLLAKLKQLVPGIPKNRRLTKLEIIQHVIDYIFDLQVALESHPNMPAAAANVEFLSELNDLYSMEQLQMSSTTEPAVVSADQCDPIYHHHHQSHQPHYHQQHPQSHSHLHPQQQPQLQGQQQQSPQQVMSRIPGSYRQPLASIML